MSNPDLPEELLDHIVDLLHDDSDALQSCCLVAKSWIPRTRKHLFSNVEFLSLNRLEAWEDTFPNPSTSPACYTETLFIRDRWEDDPVDVEEAGWIPAFSQVKHLGVRIEDFVISPVSFLSLVCSFPLLDDLFVGACCGFYNDEPDEPPVTTWPSKFPAFTGFLELAIGGGMHLVASGLLSVPSGLHFRKIRLTLRNDKDISSATALVEECSSTLESLALDHDIRNQPPGLVDLSTAKKLRDATFVCTAGPQWITATLQTITRNHRNFQQLSIGAHNIFNSSDLASIKNRIGGNDYLAWLELDRFLAQLHESRSIRLNVLFRKNEEKVRCCAKWLLPEVMTRGILGLEQSRVVVGA